MGPNPLAPLPGFILILGHAPGCRANQAGKTRRTQFQNCSEFLKRSHLRVDSRRVAPKNPGAISQHYEKENYNKRLQSLNVSKIEQP